MADINWIAASAKNFSDATAWQGGVVPGINDTAVLDDTGSGNCTLDTPINCGLIINQYSGTFSQNGQKITIPAGAVFRVIKGPAAAIIINGELDFSGVEFTSHTVDHGNTCDLVLRAGAKADWRYRYVSSLKAFRTITQESGSEITVYLGLYQGVDFDNIYCFVAYEKQDWGGKIKFSAFGSLLLPQLKGEVIFRSTCEIDATVRSVRWYTPNAIASVEAEPGCTVRGAVTLTTQYSTAENKLTFKAGDYRPFRILAESSIGDATWRLDSGIVEMGSIQIVMGTTATNRLVIEQDDDNDFWYYGDIGFTLATGQYVTWAARTTLTGTADQNIDLSFANNSSPIGIILQKTAGNVSNAVGSAFVIYDDSTCENIANSGTIEVPESTKLTTRYTAVGAARLEGTGTIRTDRSPTRALA